MTRDFVVAAGGRAIPFEFFHVTLAFLGSVLEAHMPGVTAIGEGVASEFACAPVQVVLDAVEYWKKPRVICATARSPNASTTPADLLASTLKERLVGAAITRSKNELFRPHVTLARKVAYPIRSVGIAPVRWDFNGFALVDSRAAPGGSIYTVLREFSFGGLRASYSISGSQPLCTQVRKMP